MKRDMDLIRQMMLDVETWPPGGGDRTFAALNRDEQEIYYNGGLAIKAGLLEGIDDSGDGEFYCSILGLTPEGHDFVDKAREPFIWDEFKADAKRRGVETASFHIIMRILDKVARKFVQLD